MAEERVGKPVVVIDFKSGRTLRFEYATVAIQGNFAVIERWGAKEMYPSQDISKVHSFTLYRQDNPIHPEYGKYPDEVD